MPGWVILILPIRIFKPSLRPRVAEPRGRCLFGHPSRSLVSVALSALDRAAKAGAIHPNAAARRKSRLTLKVNAAVVAAAVSIMLLDFFLTYLTAGAG